MPRNEKQRQALERLRPYVERARAFSGWSFGELEVRHLEPGPPWDYEAVVREHAPRSGWALDMGTGGGEVLSRLRDALPERVVATEGWEVNAPIAYRRLRPLGVEVVGTRNLRLPFRHEAFDLVINRHEELDPAEVARLLKPGGCVVTQQVGRHQLWELRQYFPRMTDFGDQRWEYARGFEAGGLRVTIDREHDYKVAFGTLGDLVFLLCVTPWSIPDFDIERDLDALLALEGERLMEDGLVLTETRYLLVAQKPG